MLTTYIVSRRVTMKNCYTLFEPSLFLFESLKSMYHVHDTCMCVFPVPVFTPRTAAPGSSYGLWPPRQERENQKTRNPKPETGLFAP